VREDIARHGYDPPISFLGPGSHHALVPAAAFSAATEGGRPAVRTILQ